MNIRTDTDAWMQNGIWGILNRSIFLAPRFSGKTMVFFTFSYLAMITIFLIMAANPFGSAKSPDFGIGPESISGSNQVATGPASTIPVQVPEVPVPAAPYIIVDPSE